VTVPNLFNEIRCILFDLGGVLVDWGGIAPLVDLCEGRLEPEQARQFWLKSRWVRCFETGQCSPQDFARGVIDDLSLHIEPEAFLAAFLSWDKGPLPGAAELVTSLKTRYRVACLSNNNVLHWNSPPLRTLVWLFDPCLVSFEIGLMKPDRAAYAYAVRRIGTQPHNIVYFDDNWECVDAAQAAGLQAYEVRGADAARSILEQLGALPPMSRGPLKPDTDTLLT
jgi:glucose-1-phosphatase